MTSFIYRARPLAALVLVVGLCSCGEQSAAEQAVRQGLKDPDSARFGDFYYNPKSKRACYMVNAKNSMGGYTGVQAVRLAKGEDGWEWVGEDEESIDDCRSGFADQGVAEETPEPAPPEPADQLERTASKLEAEANQVTSDSTEAALENAADAAHAEADNAVDGLKP